MKTRIPHPDGTWTESNTLNLFKLTGQRFHFWCPGCWTKLRLSLRLSIDCWLLEWAQRTTQDKPAVVEVHRTVSRRLKQRIDFLNDYLAGEDERIRNKWGHDARN